MKYYLVLTENVDITLKINKELDANNIKNRIMPLPSYFSNGCGLSIRIDDNFVYELTGKLDKNNTKADIINDVIKQAITNKMYKIYEVINDGISSEKYILKEAQI